MEPNLEESAWERAKSDSASVYRSAEFGIATSIVSLIAGGVAVLLTIKADTGQEQVAIPILAGLVALLIVLAGVFAVQLAAAPVRQRNEMRQAWTVEPAETVNVEISLRNAHRRGNELATRLEGRGSYSATNRTDASEWAEGVVRFLTSHADNADTREFIEAGQSETHFVRRLRAQVTTLASIIDRLDTVT